MSAYLEIFGTRMPKDRNIDNETEAENKSRNEDNNFKLIEKKKLFILKYDTSSYNK